MELQNLQFAHLSENELDKIKETEKMLNTQSEERSLDEKGREIILLAFVDKGSH